MWLVKESALIPVPGTILLAIKAPPLTLTVCGGAAGTLNAMAKLLFTFRVPPLMLTVLFPAAALAPMFHPFVTLSALIIPESNVNVPDAPPVSPFSVAPTTMLLTSTSIVPPVKSFVAAVGLLVKTEITDASAMLQSLSRLMPSVFGRQPRDCLPQTQVKYQQCPYRLFRHPHIDFIGKDYIGLTEINPLVGIRIGGVGIPTNHKTVICGDKTVI